MIGANYGEPFFSKGPLAIGNFSGLENDKLLNVASSPYLIGIKCESALSIPL
ncbi:MAG: hypothetical protein PUP91_22105 [Rhizonema sp. PD37]|nr:hypothetical protein [Rhizonema sp. PD37]